eukprot:TRINITY_DN1345_c0_g2_i1.p1 TRINITY_DN1345_c0_g2~~TRINITY_DN1345_c0_g2_i1.p1  ORF type:complete len:308 (-),score=96.94 TRINITY_DN1345_c0_g2_i1:163-1086(-)
MSLVFANRVCRRFFSQTVRLPFRRRRAMLYVPGSDMRKLQKASALEVDAVILDMEDGIAASAKSAAREGVREALKTLTFKAGEKVVRINPRGTGLEEEDLNAVLTAEELPDAILLPKVESADDIKWLASKIDKIPQESHIRILALIERAVALTRLSQICQAHPRLDGLVFGADDYAANMGATRTEGSEEVSFARNWILVHAAAAGIQAIDMVQIRYKDLALLEKESSESFRLGYSGKQIIHPDQIEPVQRCFTPAPETLAKAKRIVEAFRQHQSQAKGAFVLDGQMIDLPTVRIAQNMLERGGIKTH